MTVARIVDGEVAEIKYISIDDVPMHKRHAFLPVEESSPQFNSELATVSEPTYRIDVDKVVQEYVITPKPLADQLPAVKNEAQKRIEARFPQWKQFNMVVRGLELFNIWKENGSWTLEEQAEFNQLREDWAWIESVRRASDDIENLQTIPMNFNDSTFWPDSGPPPLI